MDRIIKPDYWPMLADAGLDSTILTAFAHAISPQDLATAVNVATGRSLSPADIITYIGERGDNLDLQAVGGSFPSPTPRSDAPTGLGADQNGVWFSAPAEGLATVRWYVNGSLVIEREQDLTTNRSASLAELGAQSGDVAQVCIVDNGIVGWWGRITV